MTAQVCVAELWIYPVKSLAGIPLEHAEMALTGIQGDRQWMIVDPASKFVTQRKLPKLATLRASLLAGGMLCLTDARGRSISVGVPPAASQPVHVWGDACLARPADKDVNCWLTDAVQSDIPLTLVYFDHTRPRRADNARFGNCTTYFADAAPFLVANQESLHALNGHLQSLGQLPVDMRRFRPNVVIAGLPAFAEHNVQCLSSAKNGIELALVDHCQRCSVITIDQSTGIASRDTSPFKQLAQLNSMPGKPKAPAFGVNSVLRQGAGSTLAVGDMLSARSLAQRKGLEA